MLRVITQLLSKSFSGSSTAFVVCFFTIVEDFDVDAIDLLDAKNKLNFIKSFVKRLSKENSYILASS